MVSYSLYYFIKVFLLNFFKSKLFFGFYCFVYSFFSCPFFSSEILSWLNLFYSQVLYLMKDKENPFYWVYIIIYYIYNFFFKLNYILNKGKEISVNLISTFFHIFFIIFLIFFSFLLSFMIACTIPDSFISFIFLLWWFIYISLVFISIYYTYVRLENPVNICIYLYLFYILCFNILFYFISFCFQFKLCLPFINNWFLRPFTSVLFEKKEVFTGHIVERQWIQLFFIDYNYPIESIFYGGGDYFIYILEGILMF